MTVQGLSLPAIDRKKAVESADTFGRTTALVGFDTDTERGNLSAKPFGNGTPTRAPEVPYSTGVPPLDNTIPKGTIVPSTENDFTRAMDYYNQSPKQRKTQQDALVTQWHNKITTALEVVKPDSAATPEEKNRAKQSLIAEFDQADFKKQIAFSSALGKICVELSKPLAGEKGLDIPRGEAELIKLLGEAKFKEISSDLRYEEVVKKGIKDYKKVEGQRAEAKTASTEFTGLLDLVKKGGLPPERLYEFITEKSENFELISAEILKDNVQVKDFENLKQEDLTKLKLAEIATKTPAEILNDLTTEKRSELAREKLKSLITESMPSDPELAKACTEFIDYKTSKDSDPKLLEDSKYNYMNWALQKIASVDPSNEAQRNEALNRYLTKLIQSCSGTELQALSSRSQADDTSVVKQTGTPGLDTYLMKLVAEGKIASTSPEHGETMQWIKSYFNPELNKNGALVNAEKLHAGSSDADKIAQIIRLRAKEKDSPDTFSDAITAYRVLYDSTVFDGNADPAAAAIADPKVGFSEAVNYAVLKLRPTIGVDAPPENILAFRAILDQFDSKEEFLTFNDKFSEWVKSQLKGDEKDKEPPKIDEKLRPLLEAVAADIPKDKNGVLPLYASTMLKGDFVKDYIDDKWKD